ncbi:MAG: hypothetical protein AAGB00_01855 [Planctomycetota bacterium]
MATVDDNPFASPVAEAAEAADERQLRRDGLLPAERGAWSLIAAWCGTWALNLPIAVFFGWILTDAWGRVGMGVAILGIATLGGVAVRRSKAAGQVLVRGGLLFALTQFFPILQIISGFVAQALLDGLGFDDPAGFGPNANALGFVPAVIATLVSGGLIVAAGLLVGLLLRAITPTHWWAAWRAEVPNLTPPQ